MFANSDQQVVAVCDVDSTRVAQAEQKVNAHYGEKLGRDYRCDSYADFRDLINRKDIDAVHVATPDHWHVIPALMALKAGKHVICEKPLSLTLSEGRILADVAKQSGLVFQTASENRSIESYIRMVELVKAGVFGQIKHVKILLPPSNRMRQELDSTMGEPPAELNYEMWQGQAPLMPYCASRVHYNFRWNLAYSGGIITDWGAHMIDLAHWATGNELTGPVEIEGREATSRHVTDLEHGNDVQDPLSLPIRLDDRTVHGRTGAEVRGDRGVAADARLAWPHDIEQTGTARNRVERRAAFDASPHGRPGW